MPLSREVDDVAWENRFPRLVHEHTPRLHLIAFASGNVGVEVPGEGFFKLKRDAAPHDTHAVDAIDQGFGFFGKNIASLVFDHCRAPFPRSVIPVRHDFNGWAMTRPAQHMLHFSIHPS